MRARRPTAAALSLEKTKKQFFPKEEQQLDMNMQHSKLPLLGGSEEIVADWRADDWGRRASVGIATTRR